MPGVNFLITIVSTKFADPAPSALVSTCLIFVSESRKALIIDAFFFVIRPDFLASPFKNSRCLSIAFCNLSSSLCVNPEPPPSPSPSSSSSSLMSPGSPDPSPLPLPIDPSPDCPSPSPCPLLPGISISVTASLIAL